MGNGRTSSGGCRARRRASVCDSDSRGVSGRVLSCRAPTSSVRRLGDIREWCGRRDVMRARASDCAFMFEFVFGRGFGRAGHLIRLTKGYIARATHALGGALGGIRAIRAAAAAVVVVVVDGVADGAERERARGEREGPDERAGKGATGIIHLRGRGFRRRVTGM